MMKIRKAQDRFHTRIGWLDSWHTFSFGEHHDPRHEGFRNLRVINDDRVAPGMGFGTHGHRDMEIVSYVISGSLAHKDSMGTGSVITPGDVQRMSAGTGVMHSEKNPDPKTPVHFLQIWILPEEGGIKPSYEQKRFEPADKTNALRLVAARDGREGAVRLHADVDLYASLIGEGNTVVLPLAKGRHAWVHVVEGKVTVNGDTLVTGDGAAISDEARVELLGRGPLSEVLVFDLA